MNPDYEYLASMNVAPYIHNRGNPHFHGVDRALTVAQDSPDFDATTAAALALVEATLALAYEQRTASLVAYQAAGGSVPDLLLRARLGLAKALASNGSAG